MHWQWRNTDGRYGIVAQLFHWVVAALVVFQLGLGVYGANLPLGFDKLVVLARHKSIGITIFGLVALRLIWRWSNPVPDLPPDTGKQQRILAHAMHGLLYALLFLLPPTGWLYSSAANISVSWFGVVALPNLVPANERLAHALLVTHITLAITLMTLLAGHIAAALWHHFARHDAVLVRMLPFAAPTRRRSG